MTTAQYAKHRKCSDSYVRRLRRTGMLVECEHGDIDVAASDKRLAADLNPVRGGDRTNPPAEPAPGSVGPATSAGSNLDGISRDGPSVHEAVRRERLARARLAELELGELSGQLIRKDDAKRATVTLVRQAVARMRLMGSRLRGQLAAASDPRKCEALIDADIDAICVDMQKAAEKVAAGEAIDPADQQAAA